MEKEKIESEKSIRRKRAISYGAYELKRRICAFIPMKKRSEKSVLNTIKKKQIFFVYKMLAIPLVSFCVFWLYTNVNSILLAFQNEDMSAGGRVYWTLDNFKEVYKLITEGNLLLYFKNTLLFWLVSIWSIFHSIFLTYAFHKKMLGRKFYRVVLYLPSIINAVVLSGVFSAFINSDGALGYMLTNFFGMERIPAWFREQEYAVYALVAYNIFFGFAGSYLVYSGAMANVSTEVTEAAYMDGVTMWQELLYIDIPLMWPTIQVSIIGLFSGLFGASGPILLLTSGIEGTWTLGYWIFDQVRRFQSYYVPAALGLCFTLIAFPIAQLVRRITDNMFTQE